MTRLAERHGVLAVMAGLLCLSSLQPAAARAVGEALTVPVVVPWSDAERYVKQELFGASDQYFPCASNGCQGTGVNLSDIYVESISVSESGGRIRMVGHISGHYRIDFLHPGVSADFTVLAKPVLVGQTVRLQQISVDLESGNPLVGLSSNRLEAKVKAKLAGLAFDLEGAVAGARADLDAEGRFPMRVGYACIAIAPTQLAIDDIQVRGEGLVGYVKVTLVSDVGACRASN